MPRPEGSPKSGRCTPSGHCSHARSRFAYHSEYLRARRLGEDFLMEDTVTLRVRDGSTEILFKIRRNTPILKVKEAYCSKRGIGNINADFFINGQLVNDTDTALTLELEDNDVVDVSVHNQQDNPTMANDIREDLLNELEDSISPKKNVHGAQLKVIDTLIHLIISVLLSNRM